MINNLGTFPDFLIVVDEKSYHTHRCILAKLPYFRHLFNNDCREKEEGKLVIHDVSYQAVEYFLYLIYNPYLQKPSLDIYPDLITLTRMWQVTDHLPQTSSFALPSFGTTKFTSYSEYLTHLLIYNQDYYQQDKTGKIRWDLLSEYNETDEDLIMPSVPISRNHRLLATQMWENHAVDMRDILPCQEIVYTLLMYLDEQERDKNCGLPTKSSPNIYQRDPNMFLFILTLYSRDRLHDNLFARYVSIVSPTEDILRDKNNINILQQLREKTEKPLLKIIIDILIAGYFMKRLSSTC